MKGYKRVEVKMSFPFAYAQNIFAQSLIATLLDHIKFQSNSAF